MHPHCFQMKDLKGETNRREGMGRKEANTTRNNHGNRRHTRGMLLDRSPCDGL
jgi:hypothetical protein